MNFVAHVEVAVLAHACAATSAHSPLAPVLVGAALPDLAGIGRFRLQTGGGTGELAAGIRLHHRTDAVFHADHRFRGLMAELRTDLRAAGIGRGPARACGHVGIELLLDGHLLGDESVIRRAEALLAVAADPGSEVLEVVAPAHRGAWADHLTVVAERIDPSAYSDPDGVAARLHRILARRPALAMEEHQVEVVADRLRSIQPSVRSVATGLVADTAAAVA